MMDIDMGWELLPRGETWVFNFEEFAYGFMDQVGEAMVETLAEYAPEGQTGQLKNSFYYTKQLTEAGFELEFFSYADYVMMVVEGTPPHTITPVNAKVLHWDDVYATVVQHPGSPPNDFVQRAFDDMSIELDTLLYDRVAAAITP